MIISNESMLWNDEMACRVSLTEVSDSNPEIIGQGDSLLLKDGETPTLTDLTSALQFALGDGRIWFNDERMIMLQTKVWGDLRKSIVQTVGIEKARNLFMQAGRYQGALYAELVSRRFEKENLAAALAAGPRLHTMLGFSKVVTKRFEFDVAKQHYHGEFHWHDSVEAVEHIHHLGVTDCPTCWMQIAVPMGYASTLLGFPIIFREIECIGKGDERCVVVGKDAKSWGDDTPELKFLGLQNKKSKKSNPWSPPVKLPISEKPVVAYDIVGRSAGLVRARRLLENVAPFSEPVLLLGEIGTGKEHFARRIHLLSNYASGEFVHVNCSALTSDNSLCDQALFGDGGFTDQAEGGSLHLNEIELLPRYLQAKLSMLLKKFKSQTASFRLISSTSAHPLEAVSTGRLGADLHYFMSPLPITIPPLRERRDDLSDLIMHFLRLHAQRHRRPFSELSGSALDMLLRYDYPGNVGELSNMIERGIIHGEPGSKIETHQIFTSIEKTPLYDGKVLRDGDFFRPKTIRELRGERTMEDIERETYLAALDESSWNISAAARKLGLTRAQLDYRISKLRLR